MPYASYNVINMKTEKSRTFGDPKKTRNTLFAERRIVAYKEDP